jgi:hypothetical protein
LFAQQQYVYDWDGRKINLPSFQEERKAKLLADGPDGRIVEETIRRKDAQGNPMPEQKVRIVEKTGASGEKIREVITYEADINGRLSLAEKSTETVVPVNGATAKTVVVEKPNVNGSLEVFEKMSSETRLENGKEVTSRAIYRKDATGQLRENQREAVEKLTVNGQEREVTHIYESAPTGQLTLARQRDQIVVKNPDGSTQTVVTIYGLDAPGRPSDGSLKVREQQILTARPGENNTTIESLAIRRPELADGKLGKEVKVGERIVAPPPEPVKP